MLTGILLWTNPSPINAKEPSLINIKDIDPTIVVEMRYAGTDNFTGRKLYGSAECLLCEPVARRLARVQKRLVQQGLGLKVWDCYRPLSVQKILWSLKPDDRYVANPRKGSRHNRGTAVDATLVARNGRELPMPTGFDEFSRRAHRDFSAASPEAIKNRELLRSAMEAEGFLGLATEWWHFDDPDWRQFALRDEPLGDPRLKEDIMSLPVSPLTPSVRQLVVVMADDFSSTAATLARHERRDGRWQPVGEPWPVSLGSRGLSWGAGFEPLGLDGPLKIERDDTSPAGVFRIGRAYGAADAPPPGTRWPYQPVDETWVCVDDPASGAYNTITQTVQGKKTDWSSYEMMRRRDHLYDWVINIEQNFPSVVRGKGSCIFFHVWRRPGSPTEGCTAMEDERMVELLRWLDPEMDPHLAQLTKTAYETLRKEWNLP